MDEEGVTFKLTSLLDSLPQCEDKLMTIEEINLILSAITPSTLKHVVRNLSFTNLFECLSLDVSQPQLETCCSLLTKLLDAVDANVLLTNFHQELLVGLGYTKESICNLCMLQMLRVVACDGSDDYISQYIDVLQKVISLISSPNLSTSKLAIKIVTNIGKTSRGIELLFVRTEVLSCYQDILMQGEEARFRLYECLSEISAFSCDGLRLIEQCGLMHRLLAEFDTDDVLCQLNCLELLITIAVSEHGSIYLQERGVLNRLDTMIGEIETNPLGGLLLPGLLKLFGSMCHIKPSSTLSQYRNFTACVFAAVNGPTSSGITSIAVETVGFIGKTADGKLALRNQGEMKSVLGRLGVLMVDAPTELRVRTLDALCHLMTFNVSEQSIELLSLTEEWFNCLSSSVDHTISTLLSVTRQPFPELRTATLRLLASLVQLPWCQSRLIARAGFFEYLLDRSTERGDRAGLEAKYEVVSGLAASPTAASAMPGEMLIRLREYVREGPFFVKYESQVTFESA